MLDNQPKQKVVVILRHENSLEIFKTYFQQTYPEQYDVEPLVLDRIERPQAAGRAMRKLGKLIQNDAQNIAAIVVGTKVNDREKAEAQHCGTLLRYMVANGLTEKIPVIATHLDHFNDAQRETLQAIPNVRLSIVENDNLGQNGMVNLGPVLERVLKR